jgi:hypothetical protein
MASEQNLNAEKWNYHWLNGWLKLKLFVQVELDPE